MVYTRYSLVKLSKGILWMDSKRIFKLMNIYPFQINFHLENDKLAYVGFEICLGGEIFFKHCRTLLKT